MEKPFDCLLIGGAVVTGEGIKRADVGVRGETVAAIEAELRSEEATQVIDVSGR